MVYKHPGINLVTLKNDIDQVIKNHRAEEKYRSHLYSLEFDPSYVRESVILSVDIDLDNQLRNYAYAKDIAACKRINHFLTQTLAKHILEQYEQRPTNDKHAQRWRKYCQKKKKRDQRNDEDEGLGSGLRKAR